MMPPLAYCILYGNRLTKALLYWTHFTPPSLSCGPEQSQIHPGTSHCLHSSSSFISISQPRQRRSFNEANFNNSVLFMTVSHGHRVQRFFKWLSAFFFFSFFLSFLAALFFFFCSRSRQLVRSPASPLIARSLSLLNEAEPSQRGVAINDKQRHGENGHSSTNEGCDSHLLRGTAGVGVVCVCARVYVGLGG